MNRFDDLKEQTWKFSPPLYKQPFWHRVKVRLFGYKAGVSLEGTYEEGKFTQYSTIIYYKNKSYWLAWKKYVE